MKIERRDFVKGAATLAAVSSKALGTLDAASLEHSYGYLGRTDNYAEHRIIEPGSTIWKIETFTRGPVGVVRLATDDGREGYGQLSTFEPDISATFLHRHLAGEVIGKDPAQIDSIVDRCIESNYKFPWSFVCRGLAGIDTAIWDLYGKTKGKPVREL